GARNRRTRPRSPPWASSSGKSVRPFSRPLLEQGPVRVLGQDAGPAEEGQHEPVRPRQGTAPPRTRPAQWRTPNRNTDRAGRPGPHLADVPPVHASGPQEPQEPSGL